MFKLLRTRYPGISNHLYFGHTIVAARSREIDTSFSRTTDVRLLACVYGASHITAPVFSSSHSTFFFVNTVITAWASEIDAILIGFASARYLAHVGKANCATARFFPCWQLWLLDFGDTIIAAITGIIDACLAAGACAGNFTWICEATHLFASVVSWLLTCNAHNNCNQAKY